MRPIVPLAAVVLLTAGAVSIPALTQAAQSAKHHTWKKANIDTSAMSASMSAQNPNAFQPSTGDQQPGAINAAPDTSTNTAPAAATGGMSNDQTAGTATAPAGQTDTSMQPMSGKDDSTTTSAKSKMKHGKHSKMKSTDTPSTDTTAPAAPANNTSTDQQPGAIDSGSSNSAMKGNSATMGAASSPTANPDDNMTNPDAGKAAATPSSGNASSPQ